MSNENQSLPGCSDEYESGPLPSGGDSGGTETFCGGDSSNSFQAGAGAPAAPPPSRPPAQTIGSTDPFNALFSGTRGSLFAAIILFIIVSFLAYLALQDG